jgi:hypothetical protein
VLDELRKELEQTRRRLDAVRDELKEENARAVVEAGRRAALASARIVELADELRKEDDQSQRLLEAAIKDLDQRLTATRANLEAIWNEALDQRERAIACRLDGFVDPARVDRQYSDGNE